MKKDIKSTDKISEGTLHEILLDIKYRLDHLEDIEADNRALIVKLIKQGNSIVKFLANIDIETEDIDNEEKWELPELPNNLSVIEDDGNTVGKKTVSDLINEFVERRESLKEFEEELKKNKDKITPGQVGES